MHGKSIVKRSSLPYKEFMAIKVDQHLYGLHRHPTIVQIIRNSMHAKVACRFQHRSKLRKDKCMLSISFHVAKQQIFCQFIWRSTVISVS